VADTGQKLNCGESDRDLEGQAILADHGRSLLRPLLG